MSLVYRFKKEKLEDGSYVSRPRILVLLKGPESIVKVPALIDSGCDMTVIPEEIARAIGLNLHGETCKLYAYREFTEVIRSEASIVFMGRAQREAVELRLPVLIALSQKGKEDEPDITLGVEGIFDAFDITFRKAQDRIILKKNTPFSRFF